MSRRFPTMSRFVFPWFQFPETVMHDGADKSSEGPRWPRPVLTQPRGGGFTPRLPERPRPRLHGGRTQAKLAVLLGYNVPQ